jgi:hypothetical protein
LIDHRFHCRHVGRHRPGLCARTDQAAVEVRMASRSELENLMIVFLLFGNACAGRDRQFPGGRPRRI